MKSSGSAKNYHHGDLQNALREAARSILEEEGLTALSLRAVARKAGVSHAAPYRHFANHEALLTGLAADGYAELRQEIRIAARRSGSVSESATNIGGAYMRFAVTHPALARLMFRSRSASGKASQEDLNAADAIGAEIRAAFDDPAFALVLWAAAHGLAMLVLEDLTDLGQRRDGYGIAPSRAEMLLRSLFSTHE